MGANTCGLGPHSVMGLCQAAVAEAVEAFGRLDILLCCSSEGRSSLLHDYIFYFGAASMEIRERERERERES